MVMNKIKASLFTVCIFPIGLGLMAQTANEEGGDRFPVNKQIGISMNAVPILNWIGNTFNGNANNTFIGQSKFINSASQSVTVRYFYKDNIALRGIYGGSRGKTTQENYVVDNSINNDPFAVVTDRKVTSTSTLLIGFGIEKRRSNGNLQGYYGVDITYGRSSGQTQYYYGNDFTVFNQAPTSTTDFNNRSSSNLLERVIQENNQVSNSIGSRGFVGFEYFITKGISLGAEYGLSIMYNSNSDSDATTQSINSIDGTKVIRNKKVAGSDMYSDFLDNQGGVISINAYF